MIRFTTYLLLILIGAASASAQTRKEDSYDNSLKEVPLKERLVFGGGIGASFGNVQDFFSISPLVGYKVTERMLVGTSVTYRYTKYKYYSPSAKLNDYGVNPFLRYTIFNGIFLQAEYEYLNYEFPNYVRTTSGDVALESITRREFSSFLAGGGFVQPISDKAAFYIMALYNFSYQDVPRDQYTPYPNPLIVRAGFALSLF